MGLMDSLKKATGLGLKASEHYDRAWEKGVLLGQGKYGDAAALFETAHRKATEVQDADVAARARANAALYGWLATGTPEELLNFRDALDGVADLEVIGSRSEMMEAEPLKAELDGRLLEQELLSLPVELHHRRMQLHQRASDIFKRIFTRNLVTYRFHANDAHSEKAQSRFFLHQGFHAWHGAMALIDSDADGAAENAARAVASFRQCNDESWFSKAEDLLTRLRARRTCWMCHRELAGLDFHVTTYPAVVTPYVVAAVTRLGHDLSSIDAVSGSIVLCTPCGSAVERQADRYASQRVDELRAEVVPTVVSLQHAVVQLQNEVRSLSARLLLR